MGETSLLTDLMCFGDSAGAYGASVYCAILAERARELNLDINIAVVADSGIGIAAVSPTWGIEKGALAHVFQNSVFGHDTGFHPTDVAFDPLISELQRAAHLTNEAVIAFATRFPDARVTHLTCDNDATQRLFMQFTYQDYGCHCCLKEDCISTDSVCIAEAQAFTGVCHEDCSTGCYEELWAEEALTVLSNLTALPNFVPFIADCDLHTFVRSARFFEIVGSTDLEGRSDQVLVSDFVGAVTNFNCDDPSHCSAAFSAAPHTFGVVAAIASLLAALLVL